MVSGFEKRIDLERLPAVHTAKGSRGLGVFLVVFSLVWGGIPFLILVRSLADGMFEPALLILLGFMAIGVGFFLVGLWQFRACTVTTLDGASVREETRTLRGWRTWTEPIDRYRGVLLRSEYHPGGRNQASYTLHLVELDHPDALRKVVLRQSRSLEGMRAAWEDACRRLVLPALEPDGAGVLVRDIEDLDRSVRELAGDGKLTVSFDPAHPPPANLVLRVEGDALRITIRPRLRQAAAIPFIAGMAGVFVYLGFFAEGPPLVFGILGSVFLLLSLGGLAWTLATRAVVRVGRDEVRLFRTTPWGETRGTVLPAASIESVRVASSGQQVHKGVVLATDKAQVGVGEGLPEETLAWLRNCILAVITR